MRYQTRHCALAITSRLNRREVLRMLGLVFPMAAVGSLVPRTSVAGQAASRSEAASKFLEVKGGKLHYFEWGASNTKPLLLLHPAPLNAHVWDEFGPTMARYYRVVAPDARGFGESSWSDAYTDDGFLEDIRALVTALGLKQLTLCGNSMGGTLAYYYASLYPDEVDRLIVVEAGPTGRNHQRPARRLRQLVRRGWAGRRPCPPARS